MNTQADDRWRSDHQYEEVLLKKVEKTGKTFQLEREDGWHFSIDDPGWTPEAGDRARFYGRGVGYVVRGCVIFPRKGGAPLVAFYRTEAEQKAKGEAENEQRNNEKRAEATKNAAKTAERIAALPDVFQRRIARFRAGNGDFDWEFLPYELFSCEQAVVIATAMWDAQGNVQAVADQLNAFKELPFVEQQKIVPKIDSGHSGNTFGMALRLAYWYLTKPENVVIEHGTMVPLVGCKDYGCTHPS